MAEFSHLGIVRATNICTSQTIAASSSFTSSSVNTKVSGGFGGATYQRWLCSDSLGLSQTYRPRQSSGRQLPPASVQAFIDKFRVEFMSLPFEEVAFPRGMNNIDEYRDPRDVYKKGTPIHVKGALLYNHLIRKNNLEAKYQVIADGDKIKFAYLKLPNPLNDSVISTIDALPKELGLDKYVDTKMQFQKSFLDPLTNILDVIGWSSEKRSTLESFFG